MRVVLFGHRPLKDMEKAARIRACYMHACLQYVMFQTMSNASLRKRFGIDEKNAAMASRLHKEATESVKSSFKILRSGKSTDAIYRFGLLRRRDDAQLV